MTTLTVESYEQILKSDPGNLAFLKLAKLLIDRGESARAAEICRQGMRFHPDSVLAHVLCAKAELAQNNAAAALELLGAAAQIAPGDPQAFNLGGAILHQAHLHREALPFLERAVELRPADASALRRLEQARTAAEAQAADAGAGLLAAALPADDQRVPSPSAAAEVTAEADPFVRIADSAPDAASGDPELPTMVEVSAYVPSAPLPAAPKPSGMPARGEGEASSGAQPQGELPADAGEGCAAAPPPASPFDQVADSAAFDSAELPTMVDMAAYAGAQESGAAACPPPAAADVAPLFDEEQRDLSAIFRSLGSGAAEASEVAAAGEADEPCADPAAALARAAQATPQRLLTALLSAPDGMRRTSSEAIRASKGWFAPEDLAAQAERRPAPLAGEVAAPPLLPLPGAACAPAPEGGAAEGGTGAGTADGQPAEAPAVAGGEVQAGVAGAAELSDAAGAAGATDVADGGRDVAEGGQSEGQGAGARGAAKAAIPPPLPVAHTPPPLPPKKGGAATTPPPLPPTMPTQAPVKGAGLLDELPQEAIFSKPPRPAQIPSVVVDTQTAEEIAREYERELREKLLTQPPPSFLRRHWVKFAVAAVCAIVGLVGSAIYRDTSVETQGARVEKWRADARRALPLATPQAYRDAIELAGRLLGEDPSDAEAKAIHAFASAALFQRFGQNQRDRAEAERYLDAARAHAPGLALAIDYRLEGAGAKLTRSKALAAMARLKEEELRPGFERAEVHLLLAERLIAQKKLEAASTHLTRSLAEDPAHVETLLASGRNFLQPALPTQRADPERAYAMFDRARQISPEHVGAILGLLQAALARRDQTPEEDRGHLELLQRARTLCGPDVETTAPWPADNLPQLDLVEGQLRARLGEADSAAAILSRGAERYPDMRADFQAALGKAHMRAGRYGEAAEVFAALARRSPRDVRARALHARALLALGKAEEALKAARGARGDRDLQILRGIALYELGQKERARAELLSTAPAGQNLPHLAVVYLALIDAEQDPDEAMARSLEILASIGPKSSAWPLAQSAMGRLLLSQGKAVEGRAALTAALTRDQLDFESPCALGRFEARAGRPELARSQLELALARNPSHLEARLALVEVSLMQGDLAAAERALGPALESRPLPEALLLALRLEMLKGDLAAARRALTRARKAFPRHVDVQLATVQFFALSGEAGQAQADLRRLRGAAAHVRAALADRLRRQGDLGAAQALYGALLKRTPGDPQARIGLVEIALAGSDKRARAAAQRDLDALLKEMAGDSSAIAPEIRARILSAHAQVLAAAKKKNQARRQAAAALAASALVPEAHLAKAGVDSLWGEAADVEAHLSRALRLDPALAQAHLDLGTRLAKAGTDPARARSCLQMALRLFSEGPQAAQARQVLESLRQDAPANAARKAGAEQGRSGARSASPAAAAHARESK